MELYDDLYPSTFRSRFYRHTDEEGVYIWDHWHNVKLRDRPIFATDSEELVLQKLVDQNYFAQALTHVKISRASQELRQLARGIKRLTDLMEDSREYDVFETHLAEHECPDEPLLPNSFPTTTDRDLFHAELRANNAHRAQRLNYWKLLVGHHKSTVKYIQDELRSHAYKVYHGNTKKEVDMMLGTMRLPGFKVVTFPLHEVTTFYPHMKYIDMSYYPSLVPSRKRKRE
jgi:hypothetical protein